MHALKLYGPRTGRQNSYGARAGPVSGRTIFVQNSPYGARECDVTEALAKHDFSLLDSLGLSDAYMRR